MEEIRSRHKDQQRALQIKLEQKRRQSTKKTRRGVQEECARLEAELQARQQAELETLDPTSKPTEGSDSSAIEKPLEKREDEENDIISEPAVGHTRPNGDINGQPANTGPGQGKKRNRARDRLARRAAQQEELTLKAERDAASMPDMKEQERQRMLDAMKTRGLQEHEVRADGHCLYSAVADQLALLGIQPTEAGSMQTGEREQPKAEPYKTIRSAAADYMEKHADEFEPFIEEPLPAYAHRVRDTAEWGGQIELMALARSYSTDICVLQDWGRVEEILCSSEKSPHRTLWLAYYRHGFGLGEHYNSLRKIR